MNKSHHIGKTGARARSSKAASIRQSLLDSDDLDETAVRQSLLDSGDVDEAAEAPWLTLSGDEEDWPEVESDVCDVESEINLLLGSGAHR